MKNSIFRDSNTDSWAPSFYATNVNNIEIFNCTFRNIKGEYSGGLFILKGNSLIVD